MFTHSTDTHYFKEEPEEEIPPAKPNTAMIIVLIISLLALIGFLIYEKKKRY